jgi:putative redox protein
VNINLEWKGRMAFEGVADSGFTQRMDSEESVGGDNTAGRPMEFIALGLAGCTAMDVISILRKKQQDVKDFKVKLHADRASEHPKVFTKAVIEYLVTGDTVEEAALVRAIALSAEKYCPAQTMLSRAFPIELRYKIFDEEGNQTNEGKYEVKIAGQ